MLGKYNFDKKDIQKIMIFFEPSIHTINVLLEEAKLDLDSANLLDEDFLKIYQGFKNLNFFDIFLELKDKFIYFYEKLINKLIILNRIQVVDRHVVLPNIIQSLEIILLLDDLIKKCYDNLKKDKNILNQPEISIVIYNKIQFYYQELLILDENFPAMFNEQIKELLLFLKENQDLKNWEKSSELIMAIIEEIALSNEKIHDIFEEGSSIYWKLFNHLNKICILASFSIFLEESINNNEN